MSRSYIYTSNGNSQTVAANGVVLPGSIIHRFGCNLSLNGDAVQALGEGYYDLKAVVVAEPTAAGQITATLYANGSPIPGATATATAAAAGDAVTIPLLGSIRKTCCCSGITSVTCVLDAEATVTQYTLAAEKK